MALTLPPVIEPFARSHDRESFDCGIPELNEYLRRQADQDTCRGVGRVYAARECGVSKVLGYYTLSAARFGQKSLPKKEAKRLSHYPIPAALLGRLAVDRTGQGQGLGKCLLFGALSRVLHAAETIAVYALVVDAKNDNARGFYEHYGEVDRPQQWFGAHPVVGDRSLHPDQDATESSGITAAPATRTENAKRTPLLRNRHAGTDFQGEGICLQPPPRGAIPAFGAAHQEVRRQATS